MIFLCVFEISGKTRFFIHGIFFVLLYELERLVKCVNCANFVEFNNNSFFFVVLKKKRKKKEDRLLKKKSRYDDALFLCKTRLNTDFCSC